MTRFCCGAALFFLLLCPCLTSQENPPATMVLHKGRVFVDRNENGTMDPDEPAVSGITFHAGSKTWTSSKSGEYSLLTPVPMTFPIWFEIPPGYKLTGPWNLPVLGREFGGKIRRQDIPLFPGGIAANSTVRVLALHLTGTNGGRDQLALKEPLHLLIKQEAPALIYVLVTGFKPEDEILSEWSRQLRGSGVPTRWVFGGLSGDDGEYHARTGPFRYATRLGSRRVLSLHSDTEQWSAHDLELVQSGARILIGGAAVSDTRLKEWSGAGAEVLISAASSDSKRAIAGLEWLELGPFSPGADGEVDGYALLTWGAAGAVSVRLERRNSTRETTETSTSPEHVDVPVVHVDSADGLNPDVDEKPLSELPAFPRAAETISHRLARGSIRSAWTKIYGGSSPQMNKPESGDSTMAVVPGDVLIAHRAGAGEGIENSLSAFRAVLPLGFRGIEVDVHLTKDSQVVVFHDDTIPDVVPELAGRKVTDLTYPELKRVNIGSPDRPEFPPLLADLLEGPWPADFLLMIELKGPDNNLDLPRRIFDLVQTSGKKDQIIWGSFSPVLVAELKRLDQDVQRVGIVDELLDLPLFEAAAADVDVWAIAERMARPEVLSTLRTPRNRVWVWTVNETRQAAQLLAVQVDAVITDYPRRLRGR